MIKTANLLGGWRFEGNANDWSGNGNNGTVYGATLITGKFGQAYSFNGMIDEVRVYNRVLTESEVRQSMLGYSHKEF